MTAPIISSRPRLGIDLDGVCYPFVDRYRLWRETAYGADPASMPEPASWAFYTDQWGLDLDRFLGEAAEGVKAGELFWKGDPYPGTVEALDTLSDDFDPVVITYRQLPGAETECADATRHWLETHAVSHRELIFSKDKTVGNVDVMIEDNVANFWALADAGVDAWLMDQPYNRASEVPADRRVRSWAEFTEQLARLSTS